MSIHMGYGKELQQGVAWQVQTSLPIWPSLHTPFTSKKGWATSFWFGWDRESYQYTVFPEWPLGSTHTLQDWKTMKLEVNVQVQYWYPDVQMVSQTVLSMLQHLNLKTFIALSNIFLLLLHLVTSLLFLF